MEPQKTIANNKPPILPSRLAKLIFEAAAKDYSRPEIQAAYKEWKQERKKER